ncbi:hypothetical protein N7516_003313 [Penicillium verrucosum]|uniref:uncharacterized protein n=1 Tax=Penicillium verrucosum TaxID=60171 RepID=UPI00254521E1|nr:uncharacterized protein N7516_003313 [Penicillium verrucosum]KAJ5943145.1 hypothetical protein N7516_003313 [Penicillium verrucosum]
MASTLPSPKGLADSSVACCHCLSLSEHHMDRPRMSTAEVSEYQDAKREAESAGEHHLATPLQQGSTRAFA